MKPLEIAQDVGIQKWLNGVEPTHVSSNWDGNTMGDNHKKQTRL